MIETGVRTSLFHPLRAHHNLPFSPPPRMSSQGGKDAVGTNKPGVTSKRATTPTPADGGKIKKRRTGDTPDTSIHHPKDDRDPLPGNYLYHGTARAKAHSKGDNNTMLPSTTGNSPYTQNNLSGLASFPHRTLIGSSSDSDQRLIQQQSVLSPPLFQDQATSLSSLLAANRFPLQFPGVGTGQSLGNMPQQALAPGFFSFGAGAIVPPLDSLLAQQYASSLLAATVRNNQAFNQVMHPTVNVDQIVARSQSVVPEQKEANVATSFASVVSDTPTSGSEISNVKPRKILRLSSDEDHKWLSDFLCLIRSDFVDIFLATEDDVSSRVDSNKKLVVGQVGFRCHFCAHVPSSGRAWRSSTFPSSIDRIYQSFTMMIKDHFSHCFAIPRNRREQYTETRKKSSPGVPGSKQYWIDSAYKLGLVDTPNGIHFKTCQPALDDPN